MAKYAFLGEGLREQGRPGASMLGLPLDEQVATCVAIKAAVVAERRARIGPPHASSTTGTPSPTPSRRPRSVRQAKWDLRHGEAVAIGLVFAALLARRLGRIDDDRVALHRRVVAGFDLYADIPAGASARELVAFMARDKKARRRPDLRPRRPARASSRCTGWTRRTCVATLADMGCGP